MRASAGVFIAAVLVGAAICSAAEVWQSDFNTDGNTDGVVQFVNNASGPPAPQVSGPSGGSLTVNTLEAPAPQFFYPRRSGRPLGTNVSGSNSFSGLYTFTWTALTNQPSPSTAEVAGFLGTTGSYTPQTRQLLGAMNDYWYDAPSGNYYAHIGAAIASVGYTSVGYVSGPAILLGHGLDSISNSKYQLAIGWDGATHMLHVSLFDGAGNAMSDLLVHPETDFTQWLPFSSSSQQLELSALDLSHLGWSDYAITANGTSTIWSVDSLAYFDDAGGAFAAVVPEPSALVLVMAGLAVGFRRRAR